MITRRTWEQAEELARQVHGLRRRGHAQRVIAAELGISRDMVAKYLSPACAAAHRAGCFDRPALPSARRALAAEIARELFTDGSGVVAARLALMVAAGGRENNAGGWCEEAVVRRVEKVLERWGNK